MGSNPHRVRLPWRIASGLAGLPRRFGFANLPDFGECSDSAVLTTYFTSKRDPQRRLRQPKDSAGYMRPWYETMVRHGLPGRVFHDGLSAGFTSSHETPELRFLAVSRWYPHSTNDHRFYVYDRFLERYSGAGVFMTDISDVKIANDPFPYIEADTIHVGDDGQLLRDNEWLRNLGEATRDRRYLDWLDDLGDEPSLNAGVIGGKSTLVRALIREMLGEFQRLGQPWLNTNMLVFNYVLHRSYRGRYSTSLCSRYKKFETHRTDVPFIHK